MAFKKGDVLKQKVVVIQGPVVGVKYDEDSGTFTYLLTFADAEGNTTERWFDEQDIEVAA